MWFFEIKNTKSSEISHRYIGKKEKGDCKGFKLRDLPYSSKMCYQIN